MSIDLPDTCTMAEAVATVQRELIAASVIRFIDAIGIEETVRAAEISASKGLYPSKQFRYFCGICHNIRRESLE